MIFELYDSKTDKLILIGSEKECIEYSKQNPDVKFYMVEIKSKENKK